MKPLRLVMEAFGPFASRQELDFRELGARTFFLIHGPTGAGKTTILDAMCYALYGTTSGDEREARAMRCDLADPSALTQVTFDFALGDQTYRVQRSPEQQRPKKRGAGLVTEKPTATLWSRTGLVDDAEEGKVLATKGGQVDAEVAKLVHFQAAQFRQVILLPQGQFRRLLLASSGERQQILQTLFATQKYQLLETALKEAARKLEDTAKEARQKRALLFEQAGVQTSAELDARCADAKARVDELAARVSTVRADAEAAQSRHEAARRTQTALAEREAAAGELAKIEAATAAVEAARARAAQARRAAELERFAEAADLRARDRVERAEQLAAAEATAAKAQAAHEAAAAALAAHTARAPERAEARRRAEELAEQAKRAATITEARAELAAADRKLATVTAVRDARAKAAEAARTEAEAARTRLEAPRGARDKIPALEAAAAEARTRAKRRVELATAQTELARAEAASADALRALEKSGAEREAAQEALSTAEKGWLAAQAEVLASRLVDGTACPVCGSYEHPHPAIQTRKGAKGEPTGWDTTLSRARNALASAGTAREKAVQAEAAAAAQVTAARLRVTSLLEALGDSATAGAAALEAAALSAEQALVAARAEATQLAKLEARAADLAQSAAHAQTAAEKAAQEHIEASGARAGKHAIVQEREQSLPAELRDPARVAAARDEAARRADALEAEHERARKAEADAAARKSAADATAVSARAALDSAKANSETATRELESELITAGFADRGAWDGARIAPRELAALEGQIQAHERARTSALARQERAVAAATAARAEVGEGAPDDAAACDAWVTGLANAATEAAAARDAVIREESEARVIAQKLGELAARARKLDAEGAALEGQFAVLGNVSRVAAGNNPQRMTFERYVLGALLDDVLVAATRRMHLMSKGRYRLQRVRQSADQRLAGGLDLEVYDGYSGSVRPVNTLSGGESFVAALALALGLADVVQEYQGGIKLDTLFIDEGFGSLDPESLDLALRALIDLQQGGRLVGVISHVPELKERIDVRLEVSADRRGSRARFALR